jgi:hypothetical protein
MPRGIGPILLTHFAPDEPMAPDGTSDKGRDERFRIATRPIHSAGPARHRAGPGHRRPGSAAGRRPVSRRLVGWAAAVLVLACCAGALLALESAPVQAPEPSDLPRPAATGSAAGGTAAGRERPTQQPTGAGSPQTTTAPAPQRSLTGQAPPKPVPMNPVPNAGAGNGSPAPATSPGTQAGPAPPVGDQCFIPGRYSVDNQFQPMRCLPDAGMDMFTWQSV